MAYEPTTLTDTTGTPIGRIVAAIDIGTNSVKCLVARVSDGGITETLLDTLRTTRLGEGLGRSDVLGEAPLQRTAEAVAEFVAAAAHLGTVQMRVTATSAMREAANGNDLGSRISALCGLNLDILPGEEEARLSYLGAVGSASARSLMLDIGGGSTEWAIGENERIEFQRSYPAGAVRFTDAFLFSDPPTPAEVAQTRSAARLVFADAPIAAGIPVVAVGGTARTLAMVALGGHDAMEGFALTSRELARQIQLYASTSVSQRRGIPGLEPDRADIVLGGAIILHICMRRSGARQARVTLRGLRHGVAMDMARAR